MKTISYDINTNEIIITIRLLLNALKLLLVKRVIRFIDTRSEKVQRCSVYHSRKFESCLVNQQ